MLSNVRRASWLCRDEGERERVIDMERRLLGVRRLTFVLMAAGLALSAPWIGAWFLVPLAVAVVGFAVADRLVGRIAAPEWAVAAAWVLSQGLIATSIALSGGVTSPALGWLAIPVVTLSARFSHRGVIGGLAITVLLLLASTASGGLDAVADQPDVLIHAIVLVASVALLSMALMRSDQEHRSESVLDGLTGMLNRRALGARLPELAEQARIRGDAIGVVVGDLDHFKAVNDEHGHTVGDAVLVDVAYALRKALRAYDLAYRLGGEEFLILLPGADEAAATTVARNLHEAVRAGAVGGVHVTMSFGVASSGGRHFDYDELFAKADAALYEAKAAGRDRVVVANESRELVTAG